jgi:hypothetical protein
MDNKTSNVLYSRILSCIHRAETKQARIRLYCSFFIAVVSGLALAAASLWLFHDITQSGFLEMVLLVFSDAGTIALYWRDFVSTLLEFLPAASLASCLASGAMLLLSFSFVSKYYNQVSGLALS